MVDGVFDVEEVITRGEFLDLYPHLKIINNLGFNFEQITNDGVDLQRNQFGNGLLKFQTYIINCGIRKQLNRLDRIRWPKSHAFRPLRPRKMGDREDQGT